MSKKVVGNVAKIFGSIEQNLKEISNDTEIEMTELIQNFMKDIENLSNNDYQKRVPQIELKGLSGNSKSVETVKKKLIDYLKVLLKKYEEIEKKDIPQKETQEKTRRQEIWDDIQNKINIVDAEGATRINLETIQAIIEQLKQGTYEIELSKKEKTFFIERLSKIYEKEKKKQEEKEKTENRRQSKVNSIWSRICEIVEKESKSGKKTVPECWISIRNKYFETDNNKMEMSKTVEERVKQLLEDEIYYQDVKYFTNNFSFLRDDPEVALGTTPRRKFKDTTSYFKYFDLRQELQTTSDEDRKIRQLLESDIDNANRRVLEERKKVLEREFEKNKQGGR